MREPIYKYLQPILRTLMITTVIVLALFFQSKDKLINSLKEGSSGSTSDGVSSIIAMEVEELKHERDLLREDVQQSNAKLEQLKTELQVNLTGLYLCVGERIGFMSLSRRLVIPKARYF